MSLTVKAKNELRQQLLERRIVTVKAASEFAGATRNEILTYISEYDLKIFDESTGCWINETGAGHC